MSAPVQDSGAQNLLSDMTSDIVEQKTYKDRILQVDTVIDSFDEIIEFFSKGEESESTSSSIQFEMINEESEGGIFQCLAKG